MCQHHHHHYHHHHHPQTAVPDSSPLEQQQQQQQPLPNHHAPLPPFPWHLAVFDAHCHPTDTMASVSASLPSMRAATLAIMATRSQDQHLVADRLAKHGDQDEPRGCRVLPAFGWHPWFSHQLYQDGNPHSTYTPPADENDLHALHLAKKAHYQAVLAPAPKQDDDYNFIASLPTPVPLSSFVDATRARLDSFPYALVGEIGLDKAFRLPRQWDPSDAASRDDSLTPGGREGRLLSPHRVRMPHQQAVLRAQLSLAAAHGRPVSVHGVQAHGVLYDTVSAMWKGHERHVPSRREKRMFHPGAEDTDEACDAPEPGVRPPYPPRICLHSYSGGVDLLQQWMQPSVPAKVFVSLSTAVNLGSDAGRAKLDPVVRAVPDDRILVESDLHTAGPQMDAALEDMYRIVCEVKGWALDEGVRRIGRNFDDFVFDSPQGR
ncbi:tatD related DNase domain-containing protein [Hirsutella rhossiliensis]|uniref:TatD related DNase domain-containing protein n=1 Tax=Hirsutella rhossiliensis TaxID=111463 RepID=A0A9P8N0W2_9HYPO|nr:tatD related DNase domain-containing protein [Hirsutella rhossiliensis]KAH0964537.1 tatD related DNase domain-containing protein [Hirsutella rhossiliensis]